MAEKSSKQALETATAWLEEEAGLEIDEDGFVTVPGDPQLRIEMSTDDVRLLLTHVALEPDAGAGRVDAVVSAFPIRGTLLHAAAAVDNTGVTTTVTNPVYLDGLSRHTLMRALHELVAAVDELAGAPVADTRIHEAIESPPAEADAAAGTDAAGEGGWSPTHRVPSNGLRSWDEPDPSLQPSTRLAARVELELAESRGDWARVVGSNGWTGWVDARRLESIATAARTPASLKIGEFDIRPLPLIGAAALVLAAFLPWVDVVASINSFDVALSFLWDLNASGAPYLGFVVVGLGVIAVVVSGMKKPSSALLLLTGIVALGVTGGFVVQMYRGITDSGGSVGDLFDFIGFGPWVGIGAGVVLVAGARK